MGIPGSGGQLLILLLFVLPGTVYQATRSRLRGPSPADQDATGKILRALGVSTFLNSLYLIALGDELLKPLRAKTTEDLESVVDPRWGGVIALLLLIFVPVVLAFLDFWRTQLPSAQRLLHRLPIPDVTYDPTPRAWDFSFADRSPCFVRVLTADDKWVGGWWGSESFAASYPEPLELFLEKAWRLSSDDGSFVAEIGSGSGMYIRCEDAQVVEFLEAEEDSDVEPSRDAGPPVSDSTQARSWFGRLWPGALAGAAAGGLAGYLVRHGFWG